MLAVESSRLRRWYRPGLLLIGDAAHTMSSIGAVGITVAIQDAAVASNVLGPSFRAGRVSVADLAAVQRRREWPVRIVQAYQQLMQDGMMATRGGDGTAVPAWLPGPAAHPFLRHLGGAHLGRAYGSTAQSPPAPGCWRSPAAGTDVIPGTEEPGRASGWVL
jgi:2-polyprenyl-6-methoxyphenol hydroxylase-like FAD-dependent oxidoreductase